MYLGIPPFGQTVRTVTTITATASQTTFTPTGGYTVGYCDVYYNGIKLVGGTDFTATDGLTVVLTTGATSGAVVEIITYGSVTITDAVRRSGDTFAGAVAINSTLAAGNTTITGNTTTTTLNSGNTAITGTATISGNVILGTTTISANGGVGTSGQVLTSGATGNAYWSTVSTTLDSVLGSGNTTTKALTTGPLTVNGAFTTSTNTATFGTALYGVANGNFGIGTNTPSEKLEILSSTDIKARVVTSGTTVSTHAGLTLKTGSYEYLLQNLTTTANSAGALRVYDTTAGAERMRIDSNGHSNFKTKKVGLGTYTGEGKEQQLISYTGTATNGTITLLSETSFGENGHCGMFFLNVMQAGKGVSRIYFLTGRYGACTLTMYQGGNRGAGEDAYLQLLGGTNTIGLQLVMSGFSGSVPYFVNGWIGITSTYDIWFSN